MTLERLTWRQTFGRISADRQRLRSMTETVTGAPARSLFLHPSFICVALYRISSHFYRRNHRYIARFFWHLNNLLTGADIAEPADIDEGLVVMSPAGVSIMGKAGRNLTVMPCCGIGSEVGRREDIGAGPGFAVIGDDVTLESHCGILGPVRVGSRVRVPPNTALVQDVEDDMVIEGPRVRLLHRRS